MPQTPRLPIVPRITGLKCLTCGKIFSAPTPKGLRYCGPCRKQYRNSRPVKPTLTTNQAPAMAIAAKSGALTASRRQRTSNSSQMQSMQSSRAMPFRTGLRGIDPVAQASRLSRDSPSFRLLMANLDPRSTMGEAAVSLVDANVVPKVPFKYDTTFVLRDLSALGDSIIKMAPLTSPVYCSIIWSSNGPQSIQILNAKVVINGEYTYVLSNKIGYAGEVDSEAQTFTPSLNWDKFRCIMAAASYQWAGKAIDLNGIASTTRTPDIKNLSDINPGANADTVITNLDQPFAVTAQHIAPVYEMVDVDANDAIIDENGHGETNSILESVQYQPNRSANGAYNKPSLVGLPFQLAYTSTGAPILNWAALISQHNANWTAATTIQSAALVERLRIIDRKWGVISNIDNVETIAPITLRADFNLHWDYLNNVAPAVDPAWVAYLNALQAQNFSVDLEKLIPALNTSQPQTMVALWTDVRVALNSWLLLNVFTGIPAPIITSTQPFLISSRIDLSFSFASERIANGRRIDTAIKIPRSLGDANNMSENGTFFYDSAFRLPVSEFNVEKLYMQVNTTTMFELTVNDTSPFTEMAKAHSRSSGNKSVSAKQMDKYSAIMSGMPPAHELSTNGIPRSTTVQLQARGILSDIVGFLGPVVSTIFPGVSAFVPLANQIAGAADSAFGI